MAHQYMAEMEKDALSKTDVLRKVVKVKQAISANPVKSVAAGVGAGILTGAAGTALLKN
jgi:hypothetical protein